MAKIPTRQEQQRDLAGLELHERRAVIRAVNRGRVVEDRRHAALAVGVARRQARFWRLAWLLGPIVGFAGLIGGSDLRLAVLNAAAATAGLGLMSWFWYSRARRAESANLEVVNGRRVRQHRSDEVAPQTTGQRLRAHLPGASRRADTTDAAEVGDGSPSADGLTHTPGAPPPGQRPYRPRGRKRR